MTPKLILIQSEGDLKRNGTGTLHIYMCILEASVVQWLCHSPCKPGVAGSIPSFSSPSDGTINRGPPPYDLSCWWDVKSQSTNICIHIVT